MRRYLYRIACAGSMMLNVLAGGKLYQSICARVYEYWAYDRWPHPVPHRVAYYFIKTMDWFEPWHCKTSYDHYERVRKAR